MENKIKMSLEQAKDNNQDIDNKFSKPFKSCLGKDSFYNFINSKIEERKYCSNIMDNHFQKRTCYE